MSVGKFGWSLDRCYKKEIQEFKRENQLRTIQTQTGVKHEHAEHCHFTQPLSRGGGGLTPFYKYFKSARGFLNVGLVIFVKKIAPQV